jgi:hypothetical protein
MIQSTLHEIKKKTKTKQKTQTNKQYLLNKKCETFNMHGGKVKMHSKFLLENLMGEMGALGIDRE